MPKRRFSVPTRTRTEPIDYELEFTVGEEQKVESFRCIPFAPGAVLFEAWAALTGNFDPQAVVKFIHEVTIPTQRAKFDAIIRDPDIAVEGQMLVDIADWLVGEYGKRPTEPPSPS